MIFNKLIVKFIKLDNDSYEVIFDDGTKKVISQNKFNQYAINNKINMAFIIPK